MSILDKLWRKQEEAPAQPDAILMYSSDSSKEFSYETKDSRADKVTYSALGQTLYGAGIPPQIYSSALNAVKTYPLVYGCMTARSDSVAPLGVKVFKTKGGRREEDTKHTFYDIFKNPNPYQGSFEFLERACQFLDVTGNLFIAKEKVAGTYELYILPSQYVAIIPDPKKKVKGYRFYVNGQSIDFKPEEIIHIKYNDVNDEYYGFPPLATASDVVAFEANRVKFLNNFFLNGAVPSGVLETDATLGPEFLKKLRSEWTNRHGGVANAHTLAILMGGLKYKVIASPLKDLDFAGLRKLSKEDILTIFRISDSILGSQEGTGASEGTAALTQFYRNSVIPQLRRLESGINRGLKKEVFGDGKFEFAFDLTDIPALQDSKKETASYIQVLIASSVMTPNEGRSILGLPKLTDGFSDKTYISNSQFGNQLVPSDAISNGASTTGVGANGTNGEKPTTKPPKKPTKKDIEGWLNRLNESNLD